MDSNNKVQYHIYTKIRGEWFDKVFPAKEIHTTDNFAITEQQAKRVAGKEGRVWKTTIICQQIYGDKD